MYCAIIRAVIEFVNVSMMLYVISKGSIGPSPGMDGDVLGALMEMKARTTHACLHQPNFHINLINDT